MTSDFETSWFAISMNLQRMPSCLCMPKVSTVYECQKCLYECQTYKTKHEYKLENNAIWQNKLYVCSRQINDLSFNVW